MYAESIASFFNQRKTEDAGLAYYRQALLRGRLGHWLAALTRRPHHLARLTARAADQHYAGLMDVPIDAIQGSEGRADDFDRDFNPLRETTQSRWLSVFRAIKQGRELPPVELTKVGSTYYVRDGHHRISVAHALGRHYIEAQVVSLNR